MKTYTVAGFGELIGKGWLELARVVASGVRQEIPNGLHARAVNRLVEEIAQSRMHAVFLVGGWLWGNPDGTHIRQSRELKPAASEVAGVASQVLWAAKHYGMWPRTILEVGPEINIDPVYKHELRGLEDNCIAVWDVIRDGSEGVPMIAASVSNVEQGDGLKHLRRWLNRGLPIRWWSGIHPYRTRSRAEEFPSYPSPDAMLLELRRTLGGRKFAITEAGWHDAEVTYKTGPFGSECVPRWLKFGEKTNQFSRADVATFARQDINLWDDAGAELYTWYQIRDGLPDDPDTEAHFGAYNQDKSPKLVAAALEMEK